VDKLGEGGSFGCRLFRVEGLAVEIHGSLENNLAAALLSARRLKGHPVHADTVAYWTDLLRHARRELAAGSSEPILNLTIDLEHEIAERA
jgi:hypothetical protein